MLTACLASLGRASSDAQEGRMTVLSGVSRVIAAFGGNDRSWAPYSDLICVFKAGGTLNMPHLLFNINLSKNDKNSLTNDRLRGILFHNRGDAL